jgi:hypothetical protein
MTKVIYSVALLLALAAAQVMASPIIGPGDLPAWEDCPNGIKTKLGWEFGDGGLGLPDYANTPRISLDWSIAGGVQLPLDSPPVWDYDPARVTGPDDHPAQWYIDIPNAPKPNPVKHFWASYVVEFDNTFQGPRVFTNFVAHAFPDDPQYVGWTTDVEYFDGSGTSQGQNNNFDTRYARVTAMVDIYPNPFSEELWIGTDGSPPSPDGDPVFELTEAYIVACCIPEPTSTALFMLGGLALLRRRRRS